MSGSLSPEAVATYERDGYTFPVAVLEAGEVARFRAAYDEYERSLGERLASVPPRDRYVFFAETHAYLPWAFELASHPRVLDAIESILGPDLMVWDSRWFTKKPHDPTYITWHQDGTYWALDPPKVCTAWIALSRSNEANGAMKVIPGSHLGEDLPHRDTFADDNALARGQEIAVEVDEAQAVPLVLEPGQMSIHHIGVVHGSEPNRSDEPRIGIAVRYVAPEVRQDVESAMALLVRGEDRYGHFDLLAAPRDGSPEAVARGRDAIVTRMYGNLMPQDAAG
jgi:ectoine hydroxylase-related dioxygenase (phytanoyl-CoA dioxygenase family)